MHRISVDERRARLARRHRLPPPDRATDPVAAARAVVALHATDASTVFLSVRARTTGLSVADVERALYEDRSIVRVLCMRRTLFAVPRELVPVVYAACTRTIAARERRRVEGMIEASGISKRPSAWLTRAMEAALQELKARGEAFTRELTAAVPSLGQRIRLGAGTRWEVVQSVGARVLPQLAMEGLVFRGRPRGSWTNGEFRWVPTSAWLGTEVEELDPAAARAELTRRWLASFGPATELDLRWWTGWTAGEARAAIGAVPHAQVDLNGAPGLALADDFEPGEPPEPWAALLPTLDPTTMGWKQRDWYLGPHGPLLFDSSGNAGPTVWWEGRIVGGWAQRESGEIVFRLLEDVGADARAAIEAEAARLEEWVGDARLRSGWLPRFHRELAA